MFRNNEQLREGINSFHDYIYKVLELNVPYDEFVRDMITASAVSTWTRGRPTSWRATGSWKATGTRNEP